MMPPKSQKPKLAVWKFASCDGCQLTILDCEDELLTLAGEIEIAYFLEASSARIGGPYDLSIAEGSIVTAKDAELIQEIRKKSKFLITFGACATAGGIQALRNFKNAKEFASYVYAKPEYLDSLDYSTPISDHVQVDFELQGCPISKVQVLEVLTSFLIGKRPNTPPHSVCMECKEKQNVCVLVAHGTHCMGPVTHAGCGAICPSYNRGCYSCFGPKEAPNVGSLFHWFNKDGMSKAEAERALHKFYGWSEQFREPPDLSPQQNPHPQRK